MIRKIRREEYLKGYGAMSDGERKDYLKRVGEWLADGGRRLLEATERPMAKAQNIVLLSARWKEQEVAMFAEGARLLSALMDVADTWLPTQLYAKSAYRAVRNMTDLLGEFSRIPAGKPQGTVRTVFPVGKPTGTVANGSLVITEEQKQRIVEKYTKKAMEKMAAKEESAEGTSKATQAVAAASPAGEPAGTDAAGNGRRLNPAVMNVPTISDALKQGGAIPPRPKHIDQYVHLLPEKTQEKSKQYGPLKREIEAARENMRLLMNDPHSSAADREKWAKLAARNDEKIAKINAELDREWEKVAATGRVVVDDLGMAHLLPAEGEAEPAVTQQETQPEAKKQAEDAKRREYLKKWLRDTRTQPSDERRKQWTKNCKELLALGGEMTDSIRKAGEYYGVDLTKITTNTK